MKSESCDQNIYTIAELNNESKDVLESHFGTIWVVGEISNLARPASGHLYFTLKDNSAQVRCALFRFSKRKLQFAPENGQQVLAEASVSLYPGRGDYQLIISDLKLAGDGALQIAFEKLKASLDKEGLFSPELKKPIPTLPKSIGVITSATGAALRDILKVLKRRSPTTPVIIYPTLVQGASAKQQLVNAIETANQRNECDLLILSRGGGSLEDLWPFNEECVARAIFASDLPIVTGIGHEIDFTIADFVADLRAATPSAAAESVSTDQAELLQKLSHYQQRLQQHIQHALQVKRNHLQHLSKRLRHPRDKLREQAQKLDQLEQSLQFAIATKLNNTNQFIQQLDAKLRRLSPQQNIKQLHYQLDIMQSKLQHAQQLKSQQLSEAIAILAERLDALSPLNTLKRGYAVLAKDKNVIRSVTHVKSGDQITATLTDGEINCEIV